MTGFIALRNLYLQRKRYILIAVAMMMGFTLISLITGISYGSLEAIKKKAGRYFAGHVSITGYTYLWPHIAEPNRIIDVLHDSAFPIRTVARRTAYNNSDAALFFNGETIRQRKLIGVDFASEGTEFDGLAFTQGSWKPLATEEGKDGILISVYAARLLGCQVGDDLILYLTTDTGQYNTARLLVRGIFNETSLFGYVAYMRYIDLNRLLLRESDAATDIAIYAEEGVDAERLADDVRLELGKHFKVFPRLSSREDRDAELAKGTNTEETLVVLSQNAQLAQIKQLMDALLAVTYFTLTIFIAIVMVGILNTYRVLVYERTKEIGTLRALGMQREQVRLLFLLEAAFLALLSSILGLVIGILSLWLLSAFSLSFIPAAGMFLEDGHLRSNLAPFVVTTNLAIMVLASVIAAWSPSNRAACIEPAEAMRRA